MSRLHIVRSFNTKLSVIPIRNRKLRALIVEGRKRMYVDNPSHGIAAVEGALRTSQYLDALDIRQLKIECALIRIRSMIDI